MSLDATFLMNRPPPFPVVSHRQIPRIHLVVLRRGLIQRHPRATASLATTAVFIEANTSLTPHSLLLGEFTLPVNSPQHPVESAPTTHSSTCFLRLYYERRVQDEEQRALRRPRRRARVPRQRQGRRRPHQRARPPQRPQRTPSQVRVTQHSLHEYMQSTFTTYILG